MLPTLITDGVVLRRAAETDVPAVLSLLSADQISAEREGTDRGRYLEAFRRIDGDPGELLVVADRDGTVVGTLQVSLLPGLSRNGALRAQVEAAHVAASERGAGLGGAMIAWAVGHAREQGCSLVQLTSDKRRTEAHRFYDRLGFEATHEGFKLRL